MQKGQGPRAAIEAANLAALGYCKRVTVFFFSSRRRHTRLTCDWSSDVYSSDLAALAADGLHARTDGFTSLAVLLGAGGVALGWRAADPVIGLVITVAILGVLRSAVRQVGARLMDAVDPALVDQATAAVTSVAGIRSVREL